MNGTTLREDQPGSDRASLLETLGLAPDEARAYLLLFEGPQTPHELARRLSIPAEAANTLLLQLLRRGLVRRLPGSRRRFAPSPPDSVLPPLMRDRDEALEQVRRLVDDLRERHGRLWGNSDPEGYVSVCVGEALSVREREMHARARRESLRMVIGGSVVPEDDRRGPSLATRRILVSRDLLAEPGALEEMRRHAASGAEVRVAPGTPCGLSVVDRSVALVPLTSGSEEPIGLYSEHPAVVDALTRWFGFLWQRSSPLGQGELRGDERDTLIEHLAAGMTDQAIMRALGISRRTLTRRIQQLHAELGVETRFQAGMRISALRREPPA